MEQNKDQSGAAVRGEAVAEQTGWKFVPMEATWEMTRPAFSFDVWRVRCDCGQEHSGGLSHNKAAQLFKSMADAAPVSARAADAPSDLPTEILAKVMTRDDFNCSTELGYAQFLAWAIWLKSYRNVSPDFSIMDNLKGVLSQIDNMVCGLSRAADALDSQPTDSSMPVDMSQAKRWIVQLRGRVDTLLAIINEKASASSQPTDGGVRNG